MRQISPSTCPQPPQLDAQAQSRHYIGLDVGSASVVAAIDGRKPKDFPLTPQGSKSLYKWARQVHPTGLLHAVAESTGPYGLRCAQLWLAMPETAISLLNPAQVVAFGKSQLKRGKSDVLDAGSLLRFGQLQHPPVWIQPTPAEAALLAMLNERAALQIELRRVENRSSCAKTAGRCPRAVARVQASLKRTLCASLLRLEQAMQELIAQNTDLARDAALLSQIPGLGPKTIPLLLAKRGVILNRNPGELATHAGLAPMPYSSGSSIHRPAHIDPRADSQLRSAMYLAALSASQFNPPLAALHDRLKARGKPPKVALIAVARKLLLLARTILISQLPFCSQLASTP